MDDAAAAPADLRAFREQILDRILRWSAAVGVVPCAAGVALSVQGGLPAIAALDLLGWGALAAAAARGGAWRYEARAAVLLAVFGAVGAGVLVALGPFGVGLLWLLGLPIAAAVLLGARAFWLAEAIVLAVLLAVGIAAGAGVPWWPDPGPLWWVLAGFSTVSVSLLGGLSSSVLAAGLERSLRAVAAGQAQALAANRELAAEMEVRRQAERARAALQEQLLVAQKMEVVGQLAGGLAHDLNNVLTVIQVEGNAARARLPDGSEAADSLDALLAATGSATALCARLLLFARKRVGTRTPLQVDAQLRSMGALLRSLAGERVAVHLVLGAPGAEVRAEPVELEQVLTNLVANARDALPGGGDVWVVTSEVVDDVSPASGSAAAAGGRRVRIEVRDNGSGIDPAAQGRVFEPFFTTKAEGTGLGLATVYALVQSLEGDIDVTSALGEGTTFRLLLPRADDGVRVEEAPVLPAMRLPGTPRTVLVVEDNPHVRPVVARLLGHLGCRAVAVASVREALEAIDEVAPDLVLTDVLMPGETGADLAEVLRERSPSLPILAMSGWIGDDDLAVRLGRLGVPVLRKPFTPEALGRAVAEGLASRAANG